MERDPSFNERWKEKAAHEHGEEDASTRGTDLYYSFLERAQRDPTFEPLAKELERSIGDYAESVIRLSKHKIIGDPAGIAAADDHRSRMHTSVIDATNRMFRWYAQHNIDNSWRRDIIGMTRERLGEWALAIARDVLGKKLEE